MTESARGMGQPWMYRQAGKQEDGKQCHRKEPRVLVDAKLNMSQLISQCSLLVVIFTEFGNMEGC